MRFASGTLGSRERSQLVLVPTKGQEILFGQRFDIDEAVVLERPFSCTRVFHGHAGSRTRPLVAWGGVVTHAGLVWGATTAISIVVAGCSTPQGVPPASSEQPAARSSGLGSGGAGAALNTDDEFVRDVAAKHAAAVEFSRLALAKTASPDVKSFAQTMVEEHSSAGDTLKHAVSGAPIQWPDRLDDKRKEQADELATKQGGEFDHEYAEAMVDGLQNLAAKLESRLDVQSLADWKTAAAGRTHSEQLPDPRSTLSDVQVRPIEGDDALTTKINQWAADTYAATQQHLDIARRLENATAKRSTN